MRSLTPGFNLPYGRSPFEPKPVPRRRTSMLHALIVIGGFVLLGLGCYGFWQGLNLKPHDNIPPAETSWWRPRGWGDS